MTERTHEEDHGRERREIEQAVHLNIEHLRERAEALGIEMDYAFKIDRNELKLPPHASEPMFSASLGKLPLAILVAENISDYNAEIGVTSNQIREGGGRFDKQTAEFRATCEALVEDMLERSGNTAYSVLSDAVGGPEALNAFYAEQAWLDTFVIATDGRSTIGDTTPRDVLDQLTIIESMASRRGEYLRMLRALRDNQVQNHGIRQVLTDGSDVLVRNKSGEYNGDPDDPFVYRHDAGIVKGRAGRATYAVMTRQPSRGGTPLITKKWLSDSVVGQFGAEMLEATGARSSRSLAARALRLSR